MFIKAFTFALIGVMSLYPKTGSVQRVDSNNNAYIVDAAGEMWQVNDTDLKVGDKCHLLMNTNGTPTIYDDYILAVEKTE